jgi:integral membrane protein (TIGR01906 family)
VERAPWPIGLLFGLSLAVVILLAGPLLLFNPPFTSALQVRHEVADAFGTTQAEIERVTGSYLADLYLGGPFDAVLDGDEPLLDEDERSHMRDVSTLVRILGVVLGVAAAVAVVTGLRLRREPRRQGEIMLIAAGSVGATAVLLAVLFAVAFDWAFAVFHQLLFPPGTWQFESGSDLITLFPEAFWFDAALAAGAAIVLTAMIVTVIGILRWRSGGDRAEPVAQA